VTIDVASALVGGIGLEPRDCVGHAGMYVLSAGVEMPASSVWRTSSWAKVNGFSGASELATMIPICCAFSTMVKSSSTVIGSIRRECLDHIVIFNERHRRRVLSS
jgi:hypothetical protein